jgi:hypothetical protein
MHWKLSVNDNNRIIWAGGKGKGVNLINVQHIHGEIPS